MISRQYGLLDFDGQSVEKHLSLVLVLLLYFPTICNILHVGAKYTLHHVHLGRALSPALGSCPPKQYHFHRKSSHVFSRTRPRNGPIHVYTHTERSSFLTLNQPPHLHQPPHQRQYARNLCTTDLLFTWTTASYWQERTFASRDSST